MTWCVYCKTQIEDDAAQCPVCHNPMTDGTKVIRCPSCQKFILRSAERCKYCGARVTAEQPDEPPAEPTAPPPAPVPKDEAPGAEQRAAEKPRKKKKRRWPILLVLLLLAGAVAFAALRGRGEDTVSPEAYMSSCKSVAYTMLMRDPKRYEGQRLTFSGKVLRVLEGGTVRMYMTQFNPVGFSDTDVWYASYTLLEGETPFAEGDELIVYGECVGLESYLDSYGAYVAMPSIRIDFWEEADLSRLASRDPVFGVGETWTIDGLCELTVDKVKQINNDDLDKVAAKYLVDYTYTNFGYHTETAEGIYITIDEIILDSAGTMGYRYPNEVKNPPLSAPLGETRKAQCCIGLEHAGAFQLTVTVYDADFNTHTARFNLSAE